jgi:uncharacterized cupredoxin-like copper-binding protein
MAQRQRRHRSSFSNEADMTKEETEQGQASFPEKTMEFLEVKDYRMVIDNPGHTVEHELLRKEEFSEEEQREAFKKKLRKYSGKSGEANELP